MRDLQGEIHRFNEERGWLKYHDPRSLTLAMAEELGEIARLVAWEDVTALSPQELGSELADLLIYALSFANAVGVDAESIVADKLSINRRRFPLGP